MAFGFSATFSILIRKSSLVVLRRISSSPMIRSKVTAITFLALAAFLANQLLGACDGISLLKSADIARKLIRACLTDFWNVEVKVGLSAGFFV